MKAPGGISAPPALLVLIGLLVMGGAPYSLAGQDFASAWTAYQAAVARKASAEELLPLAQAVYDALPATPADAKEQRLKAAAAFNLGAALRNVHEELKARSCFKESAGPFESALGRNALELVDPLWEWARMELWMRSSDPRFAEKLVSRIDGILAQHEPATTQLRFALHLDWAMRFANEGFFSSALDHVNWLEKHADELGKAGLFYKGEALFIRGKMAMGRGRFGLALAQYQQARTILTKVLPDGDKHVLVVLQFMIVALEEMERSDDATPLCQEIGRHQNARQQADYVPLYRPMPVYPPSAASAGQEGYVIVELAVTPEGRTSDIRVVESEPRGVFDHAAVEAAKKFRYAPRFFGDQPVRVEGVRYKFTFSMVR